MVQIARSPRFLVAFTGEGNESPSRLELLNVKNGETRLDVALNPRDSLCWNILGKHIALEGHHRDTQRGRFWELLEEHVVATLLPKLRRGVASTTTRVIDIPTGAELCCLDLDWAQVRDLAADGRSLFMYQVGDDEPALLCYDVPLGRDWSLIVGIPVALGVVLIALRMGWRRWRRKPAPPTVDER